MVWLRGRLCQTTYRLERVQDLVDPLTLQWSAIFPLQRSTGMEPVVRMQDLGSRARAIKQAGATNLPYSEAILKECWWCPHAMRGTPWVSPVQNELSLHESTFSRTVWRLYGGAKGLMMWY